MVGWGKGHHNPFQFFHRPPQHSWAQSAHNDTGVRRMPCAARTLNQDRMSVDEDMWEMWISWSSFAVEKTAFSSQDERGHMRTGI